MNKTIKSLVILADYLDKHNKAHQADKIDSVIKKISSVSKKIEFTSKLGDKIEFAVSSDGSVSHSYQQSAASKSKGGEGRSEEESQMHNYGMGSKNFSIAELIDQGGPDYGGGAFKDFYKLTPASKVSLKEIYKKNRAAIHSRDDGTNSSKIDVGTFGDRFKKDIGYYDGLNTKQDPLFADPFAEPDPKSSPSPALPKSEQKKDSGSGRSSDAAAPSYTPDRIDDQTMVATPLDAPSDFANPQKTEKSEVSYGDRLKDETMISVPDFKEKSEVSYGDRLKDETMVAIPPTMEDFKEYNALEDSGPVDIGWAIVRSVIKNEQGKVVQISGRYKRIRNNSPFTFTDETRNNALKNTLTDLKRKGYSF